MSGPVSSNKYLMGSGLKKKEVINILLYTTILDIWFLANWTPVCPQTPTKTSLPRSELQMSNHVTSLV